MCIQQSTVTLVTYGGQGFVCKLPTHKKTLRPIGKSYRKKSGNFLYYNDIIIIYFNADLGITYNVMKRKSRPIGKTDYKPIIYNVYARVQWTICKMDCKF